MTSEVVEQFDIVNGVPPAFFDMFSERLETERLVLERLCHDTVDVLEYYRLCSRHEAEIDEVTAFLTWDPHSTPKETKAFIDDVEQRWADAERAEYLIRPKPGEDGAGAIAGAKGIGIDWDRRSGELGTWLRKPFWGRGYSGERATALLELAFDRLDLELVSVGHLDGNEQSKRAIEKYVEAHGGGYDGILRNWVPVGDEVRDLHRYTITREQYWNAVEG